MTKPQVIPRALADDEIEIIRLVARCHTNKEIADRLDIHIEKFRVQLDKIHARIGTNSTSGHSGAVLSRVRMVAWAYDHGLMNDNPAEPILFATPDPEPSTGPAMLSGPTVDAVLDACEAMYANRPRGDLKKVAEIALRESGRLPRPNQRRAKPASRA